MKFLIHADVKCHLDIINMNKKLRIFLVSILLLVNGGLMYGQEIRVELGDKYFDQYAYEKAIRLYEEAILMDKTDWNVYAKLGDCYFFTSKLEKAIKNYEVAFKNMPIYDFTDHFRLNYALCILSINNCETVIKQINDKIHDIDQAKRIRLVLTKYLDPKWDKDEPSNDLQSLICQKDSSQVTNFIFENFSTINSSYSDFGGYISKNEVLYFASSREIKGKRRHNKRLYKWNNQPYLNIYDTIIANNEGNLKLPDLSEINDIGHESSVTISSDGKTMYYSGSNIKNNKLDYNKRGTSNLKIKRAKLINNQWVKDPITEDLDKINLENYSVGNPALSPDDSKLYFVTCAPYVDAKGQADIYYVELDGSLKIKGKPINLKAVNTMGRESFPFISKDTILYFSSDGAYDNIPSMGLLDIYYYDLKALGDSTKVKSMGEPFNSSKDDFAYFEKILPDSSVYLKEGFFSSNRDNFVFNGDTIKSKGYDDIYRFKEIRKCKRTIRGTIRDSLSGKILENAMITLINSEGKEKDSIKVNATGTYSFNLECDQIYSLRGSKKLYYDSLVKDLNSDSTTTDISLKLKPFPCKITIYHKYRFETILNDSIDENELKPVLKFLVANENVKIKIKSYTDSRGSLEYNLKKLSVKRAEASKAYLIKKGVKESQIISAEGFGETNPVISDEEIEKLITEKEKDDAHQKNRRSIFIIDYAIGFKECQDLDLDD